MDCSECTRLAAEREQKQEAYERAVSQMNAARHSDNVDKYTSLRALASEAKSDLKALDEQIAQHRERHTMTAR